MKTSFYGFSLIVGLIFCSNSINAQRPKQALLEGGLVVEFMQQSNSPLPRIPLSEEPNGFWTLNLDKQAESKPVEGPDKIQAVYFLGRLVDGKAELTVSVFRGSRFREFEDIIARYKLEQGQSVVVSEIVKYGFEPVTAKAVMVATEMVNVPVVNNRSSSIKVEIFPALQPMSRYVARFTNISTKPVIGYSAHTDKDDAMKVLFPGMLDVYGRPLIEPGKTYERMVAPEQAGVKEYNINAVVFGDGSYEGDTAEAADLFATMYGRSDKLAKLIPILKQATDAAPQRPDAEGLIAKINNEKSAVAASVVDAFKVRFPNDHQYKGADDKRFTSAASFVKADIIGALRNLQKAGVGRSDEEVNKAFAALVGHYEGWLARLPK